jgi:hypothetical protein
MILACFETLYLNTFVCLDLYSAILRLHAAALAGAGERPNGTHDCRRDSRPQTKLVSLYALCSSAITGLDTQLALICDIASLLASLYRAVPMVLCFVFAFMASKCWMQVPSCGLMFESQPRYLCRMLGYVCLKFSPRKCDALHKGA